MAITQVQVLVTLLLSTPWSGEAFVVFRANSFFQLGSGLLSMDRAQGRRYQAL